MSQLATELYPKAPRIVEDEHGGHKWALRPTTPAELDEIGIILQAGRSPVFVPDLSLEELHNLPPDQECAAEYKLVHLKDMNNNPFTLPREFSHLHPTPRQCKIIDAVLVAGRTPRFRVLNHPSHLMITNARAAFEPLTLREVTNLERKELATRLIFRLFAASVVINAVYSYYSAYQVAYPSSQSNQFPTHQSTEPRASTPTRPKPAVTPDSQAETPKR